MMFVEAGVGLLTELVGVRDLQTFADPTVAAIVDLARDAGPAVLVIAMARQERDARHALVRDLELLHHLGPKFLGPLVGGDGAAILALGDTFRDFFPHHVDTNEIVRTGA
jgi:hypothetical protein